MVISTGSEGCRFPQEFHGGGTSECRSKNLGVAMTLRSQILHRDFYYSQAFESGHGTGQWVFDFPVPRSNSNEARPCILTPFKQP
jgi:hypothetical protein